MNLIKYVSILILLNLNEIQSQVCPTGKPASTLSECNFNENNYHCCLLKTDEGIGKMCYSIYKNNYTEQATQIYGSNIYKLDCGNSSPASSPINPIPISATTPSINIQSDPTINFQAPSTSSIYYGVGGSNCGKKNPLNETECNNFSIPSNSCCFYKEMGITGCYWVEKKYSGIYTDSSFKLYCDYFLINPSIFIFILIAILNL